MISAAVKELNSAKQTRLGQIKDLEAQIQKIDSALAALSGSAVSSAASAPVAKATGGYARTPAQRKALSMKLKAHWAKKSAAKAPAVVAAPAAAPAPVAKPAKKKQKAMSPLGKLRIKLGALNRYGKKAEAKKVQAQITALEAKK